MKTHRKLKITLIVIYGIVLACYSIFLFSNLFPNQYNADITLFGKYIYVLDNNNAVVANYDRAPQKGDHVVCVINGKKYDALVNDVSGTNNRTLTLSATVNGSLQYFTSSANNLGIIARTLPNVGYVYQFLHSIWGIVCIIIIPCVALLIYEICQLIISAKNKDKSYDSLMTLDDFEDDGWKNVQEKRTDAHPFFGEENAESVTLYKDQPTHSNPLSLNSNQSNNVKTKFDTIYPPIDSNTNIATSFTQSLDALKYKMAFQDTHDMSNRINEVIQENNEQLDVLKRYGIAASSIENGVEININPTNMDTLKLTLRNDGSLSIATENYIANIDMSIE